MTLYESHNLENSQIPFIYRESVFQQLPHGTVNTSNWHENVEIFYIVKGEALVSNNGQTLSVSQGAICVINANALHALTVVGDEVVFRYLIVDRAFCLANGIDTNRILFDSYVEDEEASALFLTLEEAYAAPPEALYRTAAIRSTVLRLMLLLCEKHSVVAGQPERTERSLTYVKKAIDYIRASYSKNFSLEDVAAFVGVNKCYLSHEFHKYTGSSFVTYVNRTRCKVAQQLLCDEGLTIYQVGSRCGFENRSYFAKTFQRYVGMKPGEYRKRVLLGESTITV